MSRYTNDDRPEAQAFDPLISVADIGKRELPVVELDESELYGAQAAAERLVADGGCDSFAGTVAGSLGHECVNKLLPGSHKPDTQPRMCGDGGVDLIWNGHPCDVKTASRVQQTPQLVVDCTYELYAERYILVNRIGDTACRIVGYTNIGTVMAQDVTIEDNSALRYIPRDKLIPFNSHIISS